MAVTFTRTGEQIEEIHNTVDDPKSNTQFSDDIRTIAGEYRGLWPDTGGSANKGDTYQTQVSGTGTGNYFTAIQSTTVDPVGDNVNWRSDVSVESLPQYTGIVYKASGENSPFDNMVVGFPTSATEGDIVSTGLGSWKITSLSTNVPLDSGLYALPLNGLWVDDFGAVADYDIINQTGTDSTQAFNSALILCRDDKFNLATFLGFSFNTKVRISNGAYGVGDLEMQVGGKIAGYGSSSCILNAISGASSIIKCGNINVPPARGAVDDRKQGSISGISILGVPDPNYDNLTISGRRNKTHLTSRGLDLNGAYSNFHLKDLQVMFCDTNIYAEDSYTCKMTDIISRDATNIAVHMKGPNNASLLEKVQCLFSTRGLVVEGDTGGSKPISIVSSNFEYTLEEGAKFLDTPLWEMDGCYFENNSQLTSGITASGFDVLIDAVQGIDALRSDFQISNTLFNSIATTATGVDQLYIKNAKKGRFENTRFGASDAGQSSSIRVGSLDALSARNLNVFSPGNQLPFKYDTGSDADVETCKETPNGNLNLWQQGVTSSTNGVTSADKILITDGTLTRTNFATDQVTVPGFPLYFGNFSASDAGSSIQYRIDRREVGNGQIFFGVWLKSTSNAVVDLKIIGNYPGSGINSTTKSFTLDGVWRFYSIGQDLTRPKADGTVEFYVVTDSPNEFDFANITYSENFLPSSNPSQAVSPKLFEELIVRRIDESGYSADTSGRFKRLEFPVPMRSSTQLVDLSGITTSNCSISVVSKDEYGLTISATPTVSGNFSYSGNIKVSDFI